jgi:hypothetical protein
MNVWAGLIVAVAGVLSGCSAPGLHANIGIGPNGVRVVPVVTTNVGGASVSIRP